MTGRPFAAFGPEAMRLSRWVGWARRLMVMSWLCCAVAWLLIFHNVRTVCWTGPIILLLGLLLSLIARCQSYRGAVAIGVCHCAVCLLFFGLVRILNWSPDQATFPFAVMGGTYVAATLAAVIWAWRHAPVIRLPWECERCGYLLYGLTAPRCPECGTAFDPAKLESLVPPADVVPEDLTA
jgi:hypothetical protein